ncbi:F-box domain family protein [Brugia pahangi]
MNSRTEDPERNSQKRRFYLIHIDIRLTRTSEHRILMFQDCTRLFNNESMSALQSESGNDIIQDESKGLLSLLDEIIIHIIEKLSSEDIANIADTCIRLREIVRKMTAGDESLSDFSIESIDELECK